MNCAAPLVWGDGKGNYRNGTISFFGILGQDPIAITNHHVYEELLSERKSKGGDIGILTLRFDIEKRLIDIDANLDIATFKISYQELLSIKKIPAYQSSPYTKPTEGMGTCLAGYPGNLRKDSAYSVGCLSIVLSGFAVTEIGTQQIRIDRTVEKNAVIEEVAAQIGTEGLGSLGGISGCPILGLANHPCGVVPILLGINKEESDLLNSWLATPISFINTDGTINRTGLTS